jgi:hypothetical protein
VVENELAPIDFICVDREHIQVGRDVPDGEGHLTLYDERWAYCSAARPNVPHEWRASGGVQLMEIRHRDLPRFPPARA